ncbi:MAG: MlaD family protein [Elusimicrobiota bacterium]
MKPQIKLGMLLILFFISAGIVIISLGNVTLKKGYEFDVMFDTVADLPNNSVIKISGVEVGRVKNITLDNGNARVRVWIEEGINIYKNATINVSRSGIIGNTFMTINPGTSDYPLVKDGDKLEGSAPIGYEETINEMISGLDRIVTSFEKLAHNSELMDNVNESFKNLNSISKDIDSSFGEDGEKLKKSVKNINSILEEVDSLMASQTEGLKQNFENMGELVKELKLLVQDIKKGETVAGKFLASDEYGKKVGTTIDSIYETSQDLREAVDNAKGFETSWESEFYYDPDSENLRSSAGLSLNPESDKYLFMGLENITPSDNSVGTFDSGGDRINSITFKAGKNINNFKFYGGAIRSSGGLGLEWNPFKNRFKVGSEIFELSRAENPWLTVSSRLTLTDYLELGISAEDLLENQNFRAGIELKMD